MPRGLPAEAIGASVELEAQPDLRRVVDDPSRPVRELEPRQVPIAFPERDGDGAAIEVHAIAPGSEREDLEPIAGTAEREVDLLADRRRHAHRRDVRRVREEVDPCVAAPALVGEDRRADECIARVAVDLRGAVAAAAVDPSGIDATPAELGRVEDVDEKPGVARSAFDHEVEVAERADETAAGFLPRRPRRDHLRDQGVERRRHHAAGGDAGVHPDAGPECGIEACDAARRGDEGGIGVLGADARLDRDPPLARLEAGEALAARDSDLELDEVESGDRLRDAVLHL